MSDMTSLIAALYDIWGVAPKREQGTYVFQTNPYPMVTGATIGSTVTGTIQISTSGAFVLVKHAVYVATRDVRITWTAGGTDRRFTSSSAGGHVETIGGSDEFPFIYPKAYVFDAGSTITAQAYPLTPNARSVYWDFIGWRIWNVRALDLTRRSV